MCGEIDATCAGRVVVATSYHTPRFVPISSAAMLAIIDVVLTTTCADVLLIDELLEDVLEELDELLDDALEDDELALLLELEELLDTLLEEELDELLRLLDELLTDTLDDALDDDNDVEEFPT